MDLLCDNLTLSVSVIDIDLKKKIVLKASWKHGNRISSQKEFMFGTHNMRQERNTISIIYNPQSAHMVCAYKILIRLISQRHIKYILWLGLDWKKKSTAAAVLQTFLITCQQGFVLQYQ